MKTLCVCVCVCIYICIYMYMCIYIYTHTHTHTHTYIRACINLGGLCNEALGISDCVTLIWCLVNDELERMWKEVVVA